MNAKLRAIITPLAAWGLSMACPLVPAAVWSALISSILGGNITLEHIQEFMKLHGIKIYSDPKDFPNAPPENGTPNNLDQ